MQRLVIVGGGFAGVWAALAASAARRRAGTDLDVMLVSRDSWLTIRPRLYEHTIDEARVALDDVLAPVGVERIAGEVRRIDADARTIVLGDSERVVHYDRLVLAAGSVMQRSAIPGSEHGFTVDTYDDALALQRHLSALPLQHDRAGRFTAVVIGSGFTGIEVATALASRLRHIASARESARVVLVERSSIVAPDLGDSARRHVLRALSALGIESRTGVAVSAIDAHGVTLANSERIHAATVVSAGGFRASQLTAHLGTPLDSLGRVSVDEYLRITDVPGVYAAGDVAHAIADRQGHVAPMSCQCAIPMGEIAGGNAAADLLGLERTTFAHPYYVTCLDLGDAGALFMEGWNREVRLAGFWAKVMKESINTRLIYPPRPGHVSRPETGLRSAA